MHEWLNVGQPDAPPRLEFGGGAPYVAITAGMHGDEQTGVYAASKLIDFLAGQTLRGTVVVMPLCNPAAFHSRGRTAPFDKRDLNRSFTDPVGKGYTAALAARIWQDTRQADTIIDLHCCGDHASLYVLAMYNENPALREIAAGLGVRTVVQAKKTRGQLVVEANMEGRNGLVMEIPGGQPAGVVDLQSGQRAFAALCRFLARQGIIAAAPAGNEEKGESEVRFHRGIQRYTADHHGLFRLCARPGSLLEKGAIIGDVEGAEYRMPFDGTLLSVSPTRYIFEGEHIFGATQLAP